MRLRVPAVWLKVINLRQTGESANWTDTTTTSKKIKITYVQWWQNQWAIGLFDRVFILLQESETWVFIFM